MTLELAARPAHAATARVRSLSPAAAVALLVGAGFVVRLAVVLLQVTPTLLPDEYIYSALARSVAEGGLPSIRGHAASFPALLASILTAPAWLVHDVSLAYRLAQAIGALALTLTAVPVYLLARRVGVGHGWALACSALALLVPDTIYAAFLTAESFAYPLAIASVLAGVAALERPSRRNQVVFVVLAGLAAFARVQFVAIAAAFVAAALVVGLRERRVRAVLAEQALPLVLFALLGAGFAAVGLGYYGNVVNLSVVGGPVLASAGTNVFVLLFAAGVAIVPGAALGLAHGIARPGSRAELAFAALTVALALAVVEEAAVYGESVHERYVFYVVPLLAIAFARHAQRGLPHRLANTLLAALLLAGATLVPLTTLGERGEANSAVLVAVHWLRNHTATAGDAALGALVLALVGALAAAAAPWRPRLGAAVAFAVSAAVAVTLLAGAVDFHRRNSVVVRDHDVPAQRMWVDLDGTALVQASGGSAPRSLLQLFWNPAVDRVLLLPGAAEIDSFARSDVRIGAGGTLLVGGRPVRGPLLLDQYGSILRLRDAREVRRQATFRLVVPRGAARLAYYAAGFSGDGWVAPRARVDVWPAAGGRTDAVLELPLTLPEEAGAATAELTLPGGRSERVELAGGRARVVRVPLCGPGRLTVGLQFSDVLLAGKRVVAARAAAPRLVPGGGCETVPTGSRS